MKTTASQPSHPDLDWRQVREVIHMLALAVAQVQLAMSDGDDSVGTLSHSFTSMANAVETLERLSQELEPENLDLVKRTLVSQCEDITLKMQDTMVSFQFYDRLSQRLRYLAETLTTLASLMDDPGRLYSSAAWTDLHEAILARYAVEPERAMFEALLGGASIEEALTLIASRPGDKDDDAKTY